MPRYSLALAVLFLCQLGMAEISVLVNFGSSKQKTDERNRQWNNVAARASRFPRPLRDQAGKHSGIGLQIGNPPATTNRIGFGGVNRSGAKTVTGEAAERGYPSFATAESLYGFEKDFQGRIVEQVEVRLQNLIPSEAYTLRFFAARMVGGSKDCRETSYSIQGAGPKTELLLNASNNTGKVALAEGVKPDDKGKITITIGPGEKNNNANKFYYLGLMEITAPMASSPLEGKDYPEALFFGNSFTMGSGGIPYIVAEIAAIAKTPLQVNMAASGGKTLEWHLKNHLHHIATPEDFVPAENFQWDFVIMQEYSTRPTTHPKNGKPEQFISDAATLYGKVAEHSPGVIPILLETWARSPQHSMFPKVFANPAEMQEQLRTNYTLAQKNVNKTIGKDLCRVAPVGDAWEILNWEGLHGRDKYHASNRGSLLEALTVYKTIFPETKKLDAEKIGAFMGMEKGDVEQLIEAADKAIAAQKQRQ